MTLKELLTEEHVNSRFIYLLTSITVCLCVLSLCIAFILAEQQAFYPEVIGILLGGGLAGSAGRWLTGKKQVADPGSETSETTTTVEKVIKGPKV